MVANWIFTFAKCGAREKHTINLFTLTNGIASHRIVSYEMVHTMLRARCSPTPDGVNFHWKRCTLCNPQQEVLHKLHSIRIQFGVGLLASNVRQVCVVVKTTNEVCACELIGGSADMWQFDIKMTKIKTAWMSRSFSIAFSCSQQIASGIRNVVLKFNHSGQLRAKHNQAYTQTSARHFLKFGFVKRSLSDTRVPVCVFVCVSERTNENERQTAQ